MKSIPYIRIGNNFIAIPSELEQVQIVEYIEVTSNKIEEAIKAKEKEIDKLNEYKATLINAAVTGKIKVC